MTKQSVADIGKSSIQYILTMVFAAIGVYIGMRINMSEMKQDIDYNKESIAKIEHHNEIYDKSVWDLQGDCQYIKGKLGVTTTRGGSN